MKQVIRFNLWAIVLACLLTGCEKELTTYSFLAESEPSADAKAIAKESKTRLHNESLVIWEVGDAISVRALNRSVTVKANFSTSATVDEHSYTAVFVSENTTEKYTASTQFIALFPYSDKNDLGSGSTPSVTVDFPASQPYVDDNTFGKSACPMVAYGGDEDRHDSQQPYLSRILFHNLCGLVRIQLCSEVQKELQSITFTSGTKPLAGPFTVKDYMTNAPYLEAGNGATESITIGFDEKRCSLSNQPQTFYLSLPAVHDDGKNYATYDITMAVTTTDGKQFVKAFAVPLRRNGITKMPALDITEWADAGSDGNGTCNVSIAGNGTAERPFLIYTTSELIKVRNAFNSGGSINGIKVSEQKCHFRIMTSNIVLTQSDWVDETSQSRGGIAFNGYLTYYANQGTGDPTTNPNGYAGIENQTDVPIFYEISSWSTVTGIAVRGNPGVMVNDKDLDYSPFCHTNRGTIINCHVSRHGSFVMNYQGSKIVGMGGLCIENEGTIRDCGCSGTLVAPHLGGICYNNTGTITGCYAASPMLVKSGNYQSGFAGGICYTNSGTITDCYFAANSSAAVSAAWGGIAYQLTGGTVSHCYVASSGMMVSSRSIGGIVHTMTGGTVDKCWNESDVMNVVGGSDGLGGIVNVVNGSECVVSNCIRHNSGGTFGCTAGPIGGVVATLAAGSVQNCAFYGDMAMSTVSKKGAFVGEMTGGAIDNAYGYQNTALGDNTRFFGAKTGGTLTRCYGQIASSTTGSVVTVPTDNGALLNSLNFTDSRPSGYETWSSGGSEPPILSLVVNHAKKNKTSPIAAQ